MAHLSDTSVDLLNLFVRSPGEELYFFTVVAISIASLLMALGQRLRRPDDQTVRRYSFALVGVVGAWLVLLGGALLVLYLDIDAARILPPLEHYAWLMALLFLTWGFVRQHPGSSRLSDFMLLLCVVFGTAGYIWTAVRWDELAGSIDFNTHNYGAVWTFLASMVSTGGIILMVVNYRSVVDAPLKFVFFGILLVGFGGTLVQISEGNIIGDYAGPIRLAFVAALVLVPAIVYRAIVAGFDDELFLLKAAQPPAQAATIAVRQPTEAAPLSPVERESVQLLRALGIMLDDATVESVPDRIVRSAIDVLKADVAVILNLKDANYADVTAAFNQVIGSSISGIAVNLDHQPTLVNCVDRLIQRPLFPDRNQEELMDLYTRLDVEQVGPAYFQPLMREDELVAVLMVALPYSNRELLTTEEELLKGLGVIAGRLLALAYAADEARLVAEERAIESMVGQARMVSDSSEREALQAELRQAREQITQLSRQVIDLRSALDQERNRMAEDLDDLSISQQMRALSDDQLNLSKEREDLSNRIQEAEAALNGALGVDDETAMRELISVLQQERHNLQVERDRLQTQLVGMRERTPDDMQSVLDRMTQEKAQLERDKGHLQEKLAAIRDQLNAAGIEEGPVGLLQLVNQLIEQRARLQMEIQERDRLLVERERYAGAIQQEDERDARIVRLEADIQNLAGDREAALKVRDRMRAENDTLVHKLDMVKEHRTRLLAQATTYQEQLQEAHEIQAKLRDEIWRFANERSDLLNERDRMLAEKEALENEREQLLARIEGDRGRLEELGTNGVGSLTGMIEALTTQRNQLERELNEVKAYLAQVENEFDALRLLSQGEVQYEPENPEMLLAMVQELRTPMTSISGYIDLLLGESAGILGEMQRKFLQRVATNIQRLNDLLENLVQITQLDTGRYVFEPVPVDVVGLIEDAITSASIQFREKSLTVNLNLQDDLPHIHIDQDAMQQVINQLLANAYLVSPPHAQLRVSAERRDMPDDSLYVTVTDRGGGISEEDRSRVFARKYRADNPLIEGLGDTGVGLSIARALVVALGGKMWLESEDNVGTTFAFTVPIAREYERDES